MHTRDRGIILISVLLIVLLLSSVAVLIGNNYLISLKRASFLEFQTISLNMFRNIESLALKKIDLELKFNNQYLNKENPLLADNFVFDLDSGRIVSEISDASVCFNINSIVTKGDNNFIENKKSTEAFRKLMSLYEVDNNIVEEAIDQIIDWIDYDSNPRAYGLEDYYYSGPLNNPKEYTGKRLFISVNELKGIPAIRKIDWNIINNNFCAHQQNENFSFNINSINLKDSYLLSSLFPNIDITDAEYIITYMPKEGVRTLAELSKLFPSRDFTSPNGRIDFSSRSFLLSSKITFEDFTSESYSNIYYVNNNSYIVSRIYNGI